MVKFQTQKLPDIAFTLNDTIKVTFETQKSNLEQFQSLKEGKIYDIEIKEHKNKRSISQNAYLWVLINELAEKMQVDRTYMYKCMIKDYGHMDVIAIKEEAVETFCKMFENQGLGNMCEVIDSKIKGCRNIKVYYGSSTYDTKEMTRLVEGVIYCCQEQGIVTMTPAEILSLENENDRR